MADVQRLFLPAVKNAAKFVDGAAVVPARTGAYTKNMRGNGLGAGPLLAAAALAGAIYGCGSFGGHLRSGPAGGGAEGEARFRRTLDDDVAIELTVRHLRDPEKLNPPAWAYVAWVRSSKEAPALNVGALRVAKDRSGTLKTVTRLRAFDLFVTAEAAATAERPTGEPLLWISRREPVGSLSQGGSL